MEEPKWGMWAIYIYIYIFKFMIYGILLPWLKISIVKEKKKKNDMDHRTVARMK